MNMNIDTIIDAIKGLRGTNGEYYHNALGISDERAAFLMDKTEEIVYNYLEREDDQWETEDVMEDLLWLCKFHNMTSTEMFLSLCYGYNYLAAHVEPKNFLFDDDQDFINVGYVNMGLN